MAENVKHLYLKPTLNRNQIKAALPTGLKILGPQCGHSGSLPPTSIQTRLPFEKSLQYNTLGKQEAGFPTVFHMSSFFLFEFCFQASYVPGNLGNGSFSH